MFAPFPVCVVLVIMLVSSSCVSGKALRGQVKEIVHIVFNHLKEQFVQLLNILKYNVAEAKSDATGMYTSFVKRIDTQGKQAKARAIFYSDRMGGGHHDHPPKIVIPDWRIYKVEEIPELVRVQKTLAVKGLKDPWLRNEVWRHDVREFGTYKSRLRGMFANGMKYGLIAFAITTALETVSGMMSPPTHGHHGEHH